MQPEMMTKLEVSHAQKEAVDQVSRFLIRFRLTVPAILALESIKPLSVIGSQFMHILSPSIGAFLSPHAWNEMAKLLEEREGIDYVISRIEELDLEESKK